MIDIYEGANTDIGVEFNKIRLEILKDKVSFRTAIMSEDYKTARMLAYKINKNCEEFYKKLESVEVSKSEAIIGSAAKTAYDTGLSLIALNAALELAIKGMEVKMGKNLTKSQHKEVKKIGTNAVFKGDSRGQVLTMIAGAALDGSVRVIANVINKIDSGKKIEAKDLDSYYVTIKQKMKVICTKSKLLMNEVDILEHRYGAEEKKKELEKDVKDAKNILKESEEFIVDKDLMDIALESSDIFADDSIIFEFTYVGSNGEYITESFKDLISPLNSIKDKIKKIKEDKPGEYDDIKAITDFLDKYDSDITKAAKLIEEEPAKLRKVEVRYLIRVCLEFLGMLGGMALMASAPITATGAVMAAEAVGIAVYMGSFILMIVDMIVTCVISYVRSNDDADVLRNLSKIKNALNKLESKKLSDKYKKKIASIKTKISDAEEEGYAKLKVAKESTETDPEILAIYEACHEGKITEDQKEDLIADIKNKRKANAIVESCSIEEDMSLREKYNEVKRLAYEKCANGDITENDREIVLKEAYNRIFGVEESTSNDAASAAGGDVADTSKDAAETKKDLDQMNKDISKEMKNVN